MKVIAKIRQVLSEIKGFEMGTSSKVLNKAVVMYEGIPYVVSFTPADIVTVTDKMRTQHPGMTDQQLIMLQLLQKL